MNAKDAIQVYLETVEEVNKERCWIKYRRIQEAVIVVVIIWDDNLAIALGRILI